MDCDKAIETVYEYMGEAMPLHTRIKLALHLFSCPGCTIEIRRIEASREFLSTECFPPSPGLEDSIMNLLAAEEAIDYLVDLPLVPGGLSTKSWVIIGCIILISLVSAFFGLEFNNITQFAGTSFILPVGITIGIVLTSYGALFIGSHLKELSERFGL